MRPVFGLLSKSMIIKMMMVMVMMMKINIMNKIFCESNKNFIKIPGCRLINKNYVFYFFHKLNYKDDNIYKTNIKILSNKRNCMKSIRSE